MSTSIYGLYDPRFPDVIMYVGKGGGQRAKSHWSRFLRGAKKSNRKVLSWFKNLKELGINPSFRFIEENITGDWQARERFWISYWRSANPNLCNVAEGGNEPHLESCRLGGKTNGGKGLRKAWEMYPARMKENQERASSIGGKKAGINGGGLKKAWSLHPQKMMKNVIMASKLGGHTRWHKSKGIVKPDCSLCQKEVILGH